MDVFGLHYSTLLGNQCCNVLTCWYTSIVPHPTSLRIRHNCWSTGSWEVRKSWTQLDVMQNDGPELKRHPKVLDGIQLCDWISWPTLKFQENPKISYNIMKILSLLFNQALPLNEALLLNHALFFNKVCLHDGLSWSKLFFVDHVLFDEGRQFNDVL